MFVTTYNVYVPVPGSGPEATIKAGSAIVGDRIWITDPHFASEGDGGSWFVSVHYEGNLYGAENLRHYEDRLYHAASRRATSYPTVASRLVPAEQLFFVGTYEYETRRFTLGIGGGTALAEWLDKEES